MTSKGVLVVIGLLLVAISSIVQSAPVEPLKELASNVDNVLHDSSDSEKSSITMSSPSMTMSSLSKDIPAKMQEIKTIKDKRNANSDDQFESIINGDMDEDDSDDDDDNGNYDNKKNIEPNLLTSLKKIASHNHHNTQYTVGTDNSNNAFTDITMDPVDLAAVARKRRYLNSDSESNQRRKRALTTYELYNDDDADDDDDDDDADDDLLYESPMQRRRFFRPSRAFTPLYWYPRVYERSIRSALVPTVYDSPEWTTDYPNIIETDDDDNDAADDDDEDLMSLLMNDDDSVADNDYDYMRYPILLDAPNSLHGNVFSRRQDDIEDTPINENDDYEQRLMASYGRLAHFWK